MGKRGAGGVALVALATAAGVVAVLTARDPRALLAGSSAPLVAESGIARYAARLLDVSGDDSDGDDEIAGLDHGLVAPTGEPTAIDCDQARQVVQQARAQLASTPPSIDPVKFSDAASDWLDPHGLWSVAPDAPVGAVIKRSSSLLLAEIEQAPGSGACTTAIEIGGELQRWSAELRKLFDEGLGEGLKHAPRSTEEAFALASSAPFEDGHVTRSARELAKQLGVSAGAMEAIYGEALAPYVAASRRRAAPDLDAKAWSRVVMAAALRAYVPQLDAHGAWAPLDEEVSIYDLGLEAEPPRRLWSEITRTPLGVRVDEGALPPLVKGDVVLEVGGVELAGASVEQADQLSIINAGARSLAATHLAVLEPHSSKPRELVVPPPTDEDETPSGRMSDAATGDLTVDLVRYGDGRAAIIPIPDVPDDLGVRLEEAISRARRMRDLRGVVLDLRANGGGSTDGAIAAIGLFLPGASLFPMKRRDGGVEVERAPDVDSDKRYGGPLAVLVDGDSASAAEMIAGGLASYHRAVLVGDRTYGKGCAQEYLDDEARVGILRLTTLLYALPDGSPVQKTGLSPNVRITLPQATEREAMLTRALDPWRGPDVRDPAMIRDVAWPNHSGRLGPCTDPIVCRALRSLGAAPAANRAAR